LLLQVAAVHYPGLASHPQHQQLRQLLLSDAAVGPEPGFGGVFSFEPKGGVEAAELVMSRLQLALVAPSLGGVETLVSAGLPPRKT
jgi:cystathionine beta-lyase/cystathionine gamma-synthase